MHFIDTILDEDVKEVVQRLAPFVNESTITRYYNEGHQRLYDVYRIEDANECFVLKKCGNTNEVSVYEILTDFKFDFIPDVKVYHHHDGSIWISMSEYVGATQEVELEIYKSLVSNLAILHAKTSFDEESHKHQLKMWQPVADEVLGQLVERGLDKVLVNHIKAIQKHLKETEHSIIHNDLIPLNIIPVMNGMSVIIDWEHALYGPSILDMGRLLGDYNISEPWIPEILHNDLMKTYHESLGINGIVKPFDVLKINLVCAKVWNYFGIVKAFINNKWEKTPWYELNLMLLNEHVELYCSMKTILYNR